jgi:hypothetical protein
MGWLEAGVVVYLRALYYPEGFGFPLIIIPQQIAVVELVRETTTLLMLLSVAVLAGRDRHDRFFVFGYLFGVWDIVYYLGLWAFLDWPDSPLTWDVLFLIPVPWLGPVIYPVLISCCLIGGYLLHEALRRRGRAIALTSAEWSVAVVGAVVVVVAFCWNWRAVEQAVVPARFPLALFAAGLLAGTAPFIRAARRG